MSPVVYFNQLLHVDQLWGVDKNTYFFVHFQIFFVDFRSEINEKGLELRKKVKTVVNKAWTSNLATTFYFVVAHLHPELLSVSGQVCRVTSSNLKFNLDWKVQSWSLSQILSVVYFNQHLGAAHPKHWLK